MNTPRRVLPLWRLELDMSHARRRFEIAEREFRKAERELEELRKEIALRRKEEEARLCG